MGCRHRLRPHEIDEFSLDLFIRLGDASDDRHCVSCRHRDDCGHSRSRGVRGPARCRFTWWPGPVATPESSFAQCAPPCSAGAREWGNSHLFPCRRRQAPSTCRYGRRRTRLSLRPLDDLSARPIPETDWRTPLRFSLRSLLASTRTDLLKKGPVACGGCATVVMPLRFGGATWGERARIVFRANPGVSGVLPVSRTAVSGFNHAPKPRYATLVPTDPGWNADCSSGPARECVAPRAGFETREWHVLGQRAVVGKGPNISDRTSRLYAAGGWWPRP